MMEGKQLITVFIHINNSPYVVVPKKNLNWCTGRSSYMLILSYGLEGKAIIIAFLWPAEILVASKEC